MSNNVESVSIQFRLLAERFEAMGNTRRLRGRHLMRSEDMADRNVASVLSGTASAYLRCAEEVRRVLNGEIPPPVNHEWPPPKDDQRGFLP